MTDKDDILDESSHLISEIESNLQKALLKRKEQVEKELQDKIKKEKEESQKRILQIEEEFEKEQNALKDYKSVITEYEKVRTEIQNQMKEHLDQGIRYQEEIEKLTALTIEELRIVSELSLKLTGLRQQAEEKAATLKSTLQERFGVTPEVSMPSPETKEKNEIEVNLEQELSKLKKIKELLEAEPHKLEPNPHPPEKQEPSLADIQPSQEKEQTQETFTFQIPEINELEETPLPTQEEALLQQESLKERAEAKRKILEENDFQMAFQMLEKYRRAEATDYNGEISYFQNGEKIILDGESIIRAITLVTDEAKKLHQKLAQTQSPKDQFFIKQELINNQEILRKIILRSVKMCEKDGCSLPRFTSKVLNVDVLKNILEKLNMDNWSNHDDFLSFEDYSLKLQDTYYKSITPPAHYLHALVEELES